jgi:hypothetical protein
MECFHTRVTIQIAKQVEETLKEVRRLQNTGQNVSALILKPELFDDPPEGKVKRGRQGTVIKKVQSRITPVALKLLCSKEEFMEMNKDTMRQLTILRTAVGACNVLQM